MRHEREFQFSTAICNGTAGCRHPSRVPRDWSHDNKTIMSRESGLSNTIAADSRGQRPEFRVALFGVNTQCQHALEVVSRHAQHNPYGYRIAESRRARDFDLAIVDMTVAGGPEVASTLGLMAAGRPIVRLGRRGDPSRTRDDILLDGFARHVLGALNRFVMAHPELLTPAGSRDAGARPAYARRPTVERLVTDRMVAGSAHAGPSGPKKPEPKRGMLERSGCETPGLEDARSEQSRRVSRTDPVPEAAEPASDLGLPVAAKQASDGDIGGSSERVDAPESRRPNRPSHRPRALVVDDSPTVRHQLMAALRQMGMDSDTADSADEAMTLLTTRDYGLVFVDVVMPGKDGYQLTREIKKNRVLKDIPVIILTSRSSPFDLVRGALAGCSSYLIKPVSLQSLRDTVDRQIKRAEHSKGCPKNEELMGVA